MTLERPSWPYVLFFVLTLGLWCYQSAGRVAVAFLLLALVLIAYRIPRFVLKPTAAWLALWGSLLLAFFQFLVFDQRDYPTLAIYNTRWVESIGYTLSVLITLQWFSWRSRHFNWLLFSLGLLLMSTGIMQNTLLHRQGFAVGLGLFFGAFLWARTYRYAPRRNTHRVWWRYWARLAVMLGVFAALSVTLVRGAERVDRRFNEMLNDWLLPDFQSWSGFSGLTRLQGGQNIRLSNEIAFVIEGGNVPDYWRGNILTHYHEGTWTPEETLHAPLAYAQLPADISRGVTQKGAVHYPVQGSLLPHYRDRLRPGLTLNPLQVSMRNPYNGLLFFPEETVLVDLPAAVPTYQNRYGLLRRELREAQHSYTLWLHPENHMRALYDTQLLEENLQVPAGVKRALLPLAHEITRGAATDQAKAQAIERWFRQHFRYSLSTGPTAQGVDPTVDFVLRRKPAWCSWYASGMTLMLRSLDIPAHVVSGWRSMDYNPLARQWVVREKEAHDWVEMLDAQQQRWVRFDPTPPEDLAEVTGSGQGAPWYESLWTALQLWWQKGRDLLETWRVQDLLVALQRAVISLLKQPLFYGFLLAALWLNQWLKRKKQAVTPAVYTLDYGDAPRDYTEAYGQFLHWQQQRQLPPPEHLDLLLWSQRVREQLRPEEVAALEQLLAALMAWRFQTRCTAAQRQQYQQDVQKNLHHLQILSQARKFSAEKQDIIEE